MSNFSIAIKNYECIESLQATFKPGFTCITGSTNNGKSAFIRAIESLVNNAHGDSSVMHEKDSYVIGVKVDSDQVMCKRNPNKGIKTVYNVNGTPLEKVGRDRVLEADEILKMSPVDIAGTKLSLNFTPQFAYPFMLDLSPGKLYNFMAQSSNQEDLSTTVKAMKSDLRDITDEQKKFEGAVEVVKDTYEKEKVKYNNIKDSDFVTDAILNMQSEFNSCANLENLTNRLSLCDNEMMTCVANLNSINDELYVLVDLDTLIDEFNSIEGLIKHYKSIVAKLKDYKVQSNSLKSIVKLIDETSPISSLESDYNALSVDRDSISTLTSLISTMNNRVQSLEMYSQQLVSINTILDNSKGLDGQYNDYIKLNHDVNSLKDVISKITDNELVLESSYNDIGTCNDELNKVNDELSTFKSCPTCGKEL